MKSFKSDTPAVPTTPEKKAKRLTLQEAKTTIHELESALKAMQANFTMVLLELDEVKIQESTNASKFKQYESDIDNYRLLLETARRKLTTLSGELELAKLDLNKPLLSIIKTRVSAFFSS